MENLETLPFKGKKELFAKLERLAKIVNLNKKERAEYEEALKIYRDNQGVLDYALESGYAKGKAEWTSNPFADVPGLLPKRGVSQVGYTSLFCILSVLYYTSPKYCYSLFYETPLICTEVISNNTIKHTLL